MFQHIEEQQEIVTSGRALGRQLDPLASRELPGGEELGRVARIPADDPLNRRPLNEPLGKPGVASPHIEYCRGRAQIEAGHHAGEELEAHFFPWVASDSTGRKLDEIHAFF